VPFGSSSVAPNAVETSAASRAAFSTEGMEPEAAKSFNTIQLGAVSRPPFWRGLDPKVLSHLPHVAIASEQGLYQRQMRGLAKGFASSALPRTLATDRSAPTRIQLTVFLCGILRVRKSTFN
jgi:hypothetical protein